jgi:hypothetical protein
MPRRAECRLRRAADTKKRRVSHRRALHDKTIAFWQRREESPREPLDYRKLPRRPSSRPVANLLCSYVSFRDALSAWAGQDPEIAGLRAGEALFEPAMAEKKRCATAIAEALGPDGRNFIAARKAMDDWGTAARARARITPEGGGLRVGDEPILLPVWEIDTTVRPLLEAYADPVKFFRETAPRLYPQDFTFWSDPNRVPCAVWEGAPDEEPPDGWVDEEETEPPRRTLDRARLASTARDWGRFAHLNSGFREAFLAGARDPSFIASVVGPAENLERFVPAHRPGGSGDSPEVRRARRKNEMSGPVAWYAARLLSEGVSEDSDIEEARRRLDRYPNLLKAIDDYLNEYGPLRRAAQVADRLVAREFNIDETTVKGWRLRWERETEREK